MEERMTVCNMSIEAGARAGMIAPDETTFDYLRGRRIRSRAISTPPSPAGASCRPIRAPSTTRSLVVRRRRHRAAGHLGHEPRPGRAGHRHACPIRPSSPTTTDRKIGGQRARLHGPAAGHADRRRSRSTACSSAPAPTRRIEDLRAAAAVVRGHHVAEQRAARWSCPAAAR